MCICFRFLGLFLLIAGTLGAGCSPQREGSYSGNRAGESLPQIPSGDVLLSWANELGAAELAKLAAAEMVYRNRTYAYVLNTGDTNINYVFGKYFRQFRGFEVLDVERSSSLLHPAKYRIRYDFDLLGTFMRTGRPNDTAAQAASLKDYVFLKDGQDSLTREYLSDIDSKPLDTYSPFLERPNYWAYKNTVNPFGYSWSMFEITDHSLE